MTADGPAGRKLEELLENLQVERGKLDTLVESLREIEPSSDREARPPLWVDAAALRLQSLYTGIERCFVFIARVLNGTAPDGGDWHRRLLERMAVATEVRPAVLRADTVLSLGELLRFRQVVRHLYAYELDAEQVQRLLHRVRTLWPEVTADLDQFTAWLRELRAGF